MLASRQQGLVLFHLNTFIAVFIQLKGSFHGKEKNGEKNIYEQRYDKLMMLIRIDKLLKSAVITHKK